ncbi:MULTISPECIES: hypothetical protein [Streptomyces]|uniref:Uncharacterized protein n=1 Tax=Streptomyces poriferorum TaxID=2798799 RepID=A0ABY9IGN9_9ACTN|nr:MULTISPECIES: hypothetical protein [unclassified Streptomyces]MDP5315666.1 hypothetical protein [Streptomyces sp. Alt4]WLQ54034.1 hypothetical protein P8A19_00535 [Streptomyces sp. Alt2]
MGRDRPGFTATSATPAPPKPARLPTAGRRARTGTVGVLLGAGDATGAFPRLHTVEFAVPLEARRPSVRAPSAHVAALLGLGDSTARTVVSPV